MKIRGGYEFRLVTILSLTLGFLYLDRLAISYLLPLIQPSLEISNYQIGQINLACTVCISVSGIVFAMLADKSGKRKLWLAIFATLTSIFSGLCVLATSFESLLVLRAAVGIAEGPLMALVFTLVGHESPNHYGRNIGIINLSVGIIATMIGPILITQLVGVYNWQMTFLLSSVPGFIVAILIMKFVKEIEISPEERAKAGKMNLRQFGELLKYRNFVICCIIGMFHQTAYWMVLLFGPLYLTNVVGLSMTTMGFVSALAGVVISPWILLLSASDKYGRKRVMYIAYILSAIPFLGILIGGGSTISLVLYVGLALLPGVLGPIWMSVIPAESLPLHLRVTSNAVVIALGDIVGGAIMTVVAGLIADIYGLSAIFILALIGVAVCFFLTMALKESCPRKIKAPLYEEVSKAS